MSTYTITLERDHDGWHAKCVLPSGAMLSTYAFDYSHGDSPEQAKEAAVFELRRQLGKLPRQPALGTTETRFVTPLEPDDAA